MAERSVAWDTEEAISGTPFRHMIKAADTGSRFSAQLAVVKAGELIIPHPQRRRRILLRISRAHRRSCSDHDVVVEVGFHFKPRGIVHARWNPTDVCPARSARELARCREAIRDTAERSAARRRGAKRRP